MVRRVHALLAAVALATSGCTIAADMAARDSYLHDRLWLPGRTRAEVEREVGQPVSSRPTGDGGRIDTYEFKYRPRSDGWGMVHGFLGSLTIGGWNLIGIPIELARGETRLAIITYGPDDRAVAFEYDPPRGSPAAESAPAMPERETEGDK